MQDEQHTADIQAIRQLIARQFHSLSWSRNSPADWEAFLADFSAEASLYPAARPVMKQTPSAFVDRMANLARNELTTFNEEILGTQISVFGNTAVGTAGCEITENGRETNRSVEMFLLVKDSGRWQIVAQAWDTESTAEPMPAHLVQPIDS